MNREILFRGKRIDTGEWVEGSYLAPDRISWIRYDEERMEFEYPTAEIDPATVGQYTGLTDKNGTKIFEGDVIQMKLLDAVEPKGFFWWKAEAKVVRGCWVLCQIDFDYTNTPWDEYTLLHDYQNEIEVTGNIYDK